MKFKIYILDNSEQEWELQCQNQEEFQGWYENLLRCAEKATFQVAPKLEEEEPVEHGKN
jgi:hypothetical protein